MASSTTRPVARCPIPAPGAYVDGPSLTLDLEEGVQVLRITFNGGSQDLASFQITRDPEVAPASAPSNTALMSLVDEGDIAPVSNEEEVPMSEDVTLQGVQDDAPGSLL